MNPQPLITTTEAVDKAFYVIFGISGIAFLGITVATVYLCWRYNRKRQPLPISQKDHNIWLEVTWTIIPSLLVMVMFWYGWEGYLSLRRIPDNAVPVHATSRMWSWLFTYDNGKTSDKLYVPVGQPVKVLLTSEDVLHSFYVPAFRIKRDTVPGMDNYVWFVADQSGSYDLFCAEYCGVGHSRMITTVEAIPAPEFAAWLNAKPVVADLGKELLQKYSCLGCHSLDGARMVGPTFQNIGGRQVVVTSNGETRTLTVDRAYLEKSIVDPGADIVDGYPPAMPSFAGKIPEADMTGIIDYLMGLQAAGQASATGQAQQSEPAAAKAPPAEKAPPAPATGAEAVKELLQKYGCLGCHTLDGSRLVGPSFKDIGGHQVDVTTDGKKRTVTVDRAYLEKSIVDPGADIVDGYPPAMPSFAGKIPEADMNSIIDFLLGKAGQATGAKPAQAAGSTSPASHGEALANQNGCLGCHSTDGSRRVGPSFKGLMGSERTVVKDGKTVQVKADTSYLVRAIREPGAEILEGYPPAMPPYPGLSDEDIRALQAWLETLK